MWVRGLKLDIMNRYQDYENVAPRVGAWIETFFFPSRKIRAQVAPRVGAWIETLIWNEDIAKTLVAPRVGAWIETREIRRSCCSRTGRTPCGCVD